MLCIFKTHQLPLGWSNWAPAGAWQNTHSGEISTEKWSSCGSRGDNR